jgi:hypothetical protein
LAGAARGRARPRPATGHQDRWVWPVTQTLQQPDGHHDWIIQALIDIDASDETGGLVLVTQAFRRLDA